MSWRLSSSNLHMCVLRYLREGVSAMMLVKVSRHNYKTRLKLFIPSPICQLVGSRMQSGVS